MPDKKKIEKIDLNPCEINKNAVDPKKISITLEIQFNSN